MKIKLAQSLFIIFSIFFISCNTNNNAGIEKKLDDISDNATIDTVFTYLQQVMQWVK